MKDIALLLAGLALFSGCAAKSELLKDDLKYEEAYLGDISMRSFSVVDERKDVSDKRFDPMFFARSAVKESVSPVLSQEHRELIGNEILKHTGKNGQDYDIVVYVQKAEKTLRSEFPNKYEGAGVALKIRLSNLNNTKTCSGEASLEVKSLKASDEYLEKIYQKALKDCVQQCFIALKGSSSSK